MPVIPALSKVYPRLHATIANKQNEKRCLGLAQLLVENLKAFQGNNGQRPTTQVAGPKTPKAVPKLELNKKVEEEKRNQEKNKLTMMLTMAKNIPPIKPGEKPQGFRKSIDSYSSKPTNVPTSSRLSQSKKSCAMLTKAKASTQSVVESLKSDPAKVGKISDYNLIGQIGQGAYAVVKSGVHKPTGKKVAVKVYEKYKIADPQRKTCVNREIRIMKRLNHENIVQLYETIDTSKQLFLIMELVKGRSLYSYLHTKQGRKLSEPECMKIFSQVVSGIEYCHRNNVVHRDIKMENLLLDERHNIKIIDFGFSICAATNQKLKIFCGTPSYMAPEIVMKRDYYGPPADIWSLGILLFAMLCGCFPFRGATEHELFRSISRCQFTFPSSVSNEAKKIVSKMLCLNPEKRATASQICKEASLLAENGAKSSSGLVAFGTGVVANKEDEINGKGKGEYKKEAIDKVAKLGYSYLKIASELKEQKGPAFDAYVGIIKELEKTGGKRTD